MSRLEDLLENSIIAEAIGASERDEHFDWESAAVRQSLLIARAGELFVLEQIQAERAADDRFEQANA